MSESREAWMWWNQILRMELFIWDTLMVQSLFGHRIKNHMLPKCYVIRWAINLFMIILKSIKSNILDTSISLDGNYMATSSMDSSIRIWDLRTWKNIAIHRLPKGARNIQFSQKGKLATAFENVVEVWNGKLSAFLVLQSYLWRLRALESREMWETLCKSYNSYTNSIDFILSVWRRSWYWIKTRILIDFSSWCWRTKPRFLFIQSISNKETERPDRS